MAISPKGSQAMELLANSALMTLTERFTSAMGDRNYEEALTVLSTMLLMTSSLVLMKDATNVPDAEAVVLRALTSLQSEIDVMTSIMFGGKNEGGN